MPSSPMEALARHLPEISVVTIVLIRRIASGLARVAARLCAG